ncbi:MAG: hypothetical protein HZY73_07090 [Micropruina sp.]|nr:MAG: hypothetical protein HZY73_07090 [Micropruina sp.]
MIEWLLGELGLILAFGVLFGAGLPTLFALGVRALAGSSDAAKSASSRRWLRVTAWTLFALAVVVIAAALGLVLASSLGYTVSFNQWPPAVARKH